MSHPTVLRVQPLYEKSGPGKISIHQSAVHNARIGGDIAHVDKIRQNKNKTLLGSGDIVKDVTPLLTQYPKASKKGPVAGEIIITANKDFFISLSEEERYKWAKDSLAWAVTEFDGNNKGKVVSCIWHRDEEAEHLHIIVVPIIDSVSGNQYHRKTIKKINYSRVLGKPRGGEKNIPPSERLWGKKQTSYAEYMGEMGHQLIRGVKNRHWRKHTSPAEYRQKIAAEMEGFEQRLDNLELDGKITKKEAVQYAAREIAKYTSEMEKTVDAQKNLIEALEQIIHDTALSLRCSNASQLSKYARHLAIGIASIQSNPEELAQEGKEIEDTWLQKETTKEQKHQGSTSDQPSRTRLARRKKGQK